MMISFDSVPVYLACGPTDLRKQINGLCTTVSADFEMDPFDSALFVFCNRNKNRLKVLFFDGDGFMMITKRLVRIPATSGHRFRSHFGQVFQSIRYTRPALS